MSAKLMKATNMTGGRAKIVLEVEKTTDWAAPKVREVRDLLSDD